MGDLDELAQAARATLPYAKPAPRRRKPKTLFAAIAIAILLGVSLIAYVAARGIGANADPGFAVRQIVRADGFGSVLVSRCFVIENRQQSPLVVRGVRVNGEYDCPVGHMVTPETAFPDPSRSWPVTVTVGDEAVAFVYYINTTSPASYAKDPVFVEVDTDRGRFRYDVAGRVLSRE